MNPVLIILILLSGVLLWFLLAFLFRPVGSLFKKLFDDVKEAINETENDDDKKGK